MVGWQGVNDPPNDRNALQFAQWLHVLLPKILHILLYHTITKGVVGHNRHAVGIRANEGQQALAHGAHTRIRKGQAKDILWAGIGGEQDIADSSGEHLRFARTGACQHQHRAFRLVHSCTLPRIEGTEQASKCFVIWI